MLDIDINSLKNLYTEQALLAQKEGFKIYIFGAGIVGQIVEKQFLEPYGVRADFFVEANAFYRGPREVSGIPVIPYSDVDTLDEKMLLLVAYDYTGLDTYDTPSFDIKGKAFVGDVGTFTGCRQNGCLDVSFFKSRYSEFEKTYAMLSDRTSKEIMVAFFKTRLTSDLIYLKDLWKKDQYFDEEIVDINTIDNYVDCGAFIGDSYDELMRKRSAKELENAWLFEPEQKNLSILQEKYARCSNVDIIAKGVWDERKDLYFNGDGISGTISNTGTRVEVDSIDNICTGHQVDFIKMDIEGSEYNALLGAKKTIQTYLPTLAICVYHKKDDLIKIPNLIQSFTNEYNYFLRIYKPYTHELVLYAVKKSS